MHSFAIDLWLVVITIYADTLKVISRVIEIVVMLTTQCGSTCTSQKESVIVSLTVTVVLASESEI